MKISHIALGSILFRLLTDKQSGELDSPEKVSAFVEDIAEVVSNHCGGDVSVDGTEMRAWANDSSPDNGGIWNPDWITTAFEQAGREPEVRDLYTLVAKKGGKTAHSPKEVKGMDPRHVWTVLDIGRGEPVCRPGIQNGGNKKWAEYPRVLHYLVSEEPWVNEEEFYLLASDDREFFAITCRLDGYDNQVALVRGDDEGQARDTAANMLREHNGMDDDYEVHVDAVVVSKTRMSTCETF